MSSKIINPNTPTIKEESSHQIQSTKKVWSTISIRYKPNTQDDRTNKHGTNVVQVTPRSYNNQQHVQNPMNNAKYEKKFEPAPYTMVKSFSTRLRYN